jgi:hypothetical protein
VVQTVNPDGSLVGVSQIVTQHLHMCRTNNVTAAPIWDLPASSAATPTDVTGTNVHKCVLNFANGQSAQYTLAITSSELSTVTIDSVMIAWSSAQTSATGTFTLQAGCRALSATGTDDQAFQVWFAPAKDTSPGTANRMTKTSGTNVALGGTCTAATDQMLHLKISWTAGTATSVNVDEVVLRYH